MKKLVLIVVVLLAIAGMAKAQDIYSVGNFTNSSGFQCAAVYLNDQKLYEKDPPLGDYNFDSPSLVVNGDDIYWAMNSVYAAGGYNYGDIYKNGTIYFNSPGGQNFHINDLACGDGHLYAGGSKLVEGSGGVGSVSRAAIWMDDNTTPLYILGETGHASSVTAMAYYGGYLVSVGAENNGSGSSNGKVWLNGSQLHDYGSSVYPQDVAVYDDEIYVLVKAYSNYPAGWTYKVYKGTQVLFTILGANADGEAKSICVDAGDVYVTGNLNGAVKVWKNGSVLCTVSNSSSGASLTSMANHRGIYHAGYLNGSAAIWHGSNNFAYIPSNCNVINDIYVEDHCLNNDIWTLPFADSFETDYTPWICWTNVDTDHNNGVYQSYWHRCGSRIGQAATGEYFIRHEGNPTVNQTGWLVTPRLFLQPDRDFTTLTFKEMTGGSGFEATLSVRVSTNSDPNNADAYTQVWSSNSNAGFSWNTRSIDLSAYQGKAIYVAFRFTGVNSWDWYIDDVEITEGWSPCSVAATVPFLDSFDEEINYCWYNLDLDYSGDNKCWQYSESNHYAVHPFGPQGVPQEGWLFSRSVMLPSTSNCVLTFNSKSSQPNQGSGKRNSVWIAVDETGVPDMDHYTKIWEQTSGFTSDWTEINIPLSSYAGHNVRVAFKYEGNHGHNWAIDDVGITEVNPQYTITVNANNNAWGTVSGGGTYNVGTSCTITATPASGYQFQSWKKNGTVVSTNATYTFTVTENATYTAFFGETPINYFTITTNVNPAEAGSVAGGGTYQEGSSITLTAISNPGYMFNHWNDGVTDNPRTVTVTQNITYTAYYDLEEYTIQVYASPSEGGEVSGGGNYHYGDIASLTATPYAGYEFAGWSDGNNDNPREVTIVAATYYVAIFSETGTNYYTVTTYVNPEGAGTVTGGGTYQEATVTTLVAEANPGYVFDHWSDGVTANPRVITVNDNMSFTAYFNQITYTITVNASPASGGIVEGEGSYTYGSTATLYAIPNGGYVFVGWSDGSSENPHYVTVTGDATYTAVFSPAGAVYYMVSTFVSPADAGSVTGAGAYPEGTSVNLIATANEGYTFDHWNDGVTQNPRTITVDNNKSFTAYFTASTYTLSVGSSPSNGGVVTGGGSYSVGASATIQAFPNEGYEFDFWNDGNKDNPRTVTMNGDLVLVAFFKTTGVEELSQKAIVIYPNPANESIHVEGLEHACQGQIYNSLGALVKVVNIDGDEVIGVSDLSSGLYLLRCGNRAIRFVKY